MHPKFLLTTIVMMMVMCFSNTVMAAQGLCGFPPRSNLKSWSSEEFFGRFPDPGPAREAAVVAEVLKGNVPEQMRQLIPISISALYHGERVTLELDVVPDYLLIGTDQDFVRVPLTNYAAQFLASELGFVMPTKFLVDQIYDQADVKLVPQPTDWYKYEGKMRSGPNYVLFHETVESQLKGRGGLIAGHKKDVVATNLLDRADTRVAIYGWQRPGNKPIQPLATPHSADYEDYSHGIRFLGPQLRILSGRNVTRVSLVEALTDRELGAILNGGQGALNDPRAARICEPDFARAVGVPRTECPPRPSYCKS